MKVNQYDYRNELMTSYVNHFRAELINGQNSAEVDATHAELDKEQKDTKGKISYKRNMRKYKENNRKYLQKKEEEEEKEMKIRRLKEEKSVKKEKGKYNDVVRNYNMNLAKKEVMERVGNKEVIKIKEEEKKDEMTKDDQLYYNDEEDKKNKLMQVNPINESQLREDDIKEDQYNIELQLQMQSQQLKPQSQSHPIPETQEEQLSNNITINLQKNIDNVLQSHLQAQIKNKTIKSSYNPQYEQDTIHQRITSNLHQITSFRRKGFIQTSSIPPESSPSKPLKNKAKPNISSLQKLRFNKALKQILSERLGAKNIHLPNICSCGQLQKNLDMLISDKNISVYSVFNITCANNCIYYKRKEDYAKNIEDILNCVRDFSYEAFYKNEKQ